MKRLRLAMIPVALVAPGILFVVNGSGPFDSRLSKDQQIVQALNRLTFGPRPGDADEVRKIGLEKWIDIQLHPDKVAENPLLDSRLKPMETVRMSPAEIIKEYPLVAPGIAQAGMMRMNEIVPQDQVRRFTGGTYEEKMAVLKPLDAAKRKQFLAMIAPNALLGVPELQKEAEEARKARQDDMQKEFRKRMPPLMDLLTQDQMQTAMRGNRDQLLDLFSYLDETKRKQVAAALPPNALAEMPEMRRVGWKYRQPQQVITSDMREAKVFRALYTNRQLEEVLVDFWFNHFNVNEGKQYDRPLVESFERDAIRPHVLGKFKDLLLATARHPAMLYYLDNWESMSPGIFDIGPFSGPPQQMMQQVSRQAHGLNENYGRELMELHTLGVDGGYTQDDVIAVAKCFTGWTVRKPNTEPEYVFAGFMHDAGEKTVMGHKIAANGGEQDGLQVLEMLAHHPSTAKHISLQLAQRFVADDPPQALVDRMAQTFLKTDGDLRAVMQTMLTSTEFWSEGAWQSKMKSPLEMVVSSVRALGADTIDTFTLVQKIADLGEPLYGKVEPTGYPLTGDSWMNTASIMGRMTFATGLLSGQITGVKVNGARWDGKDAAAIARDLLGREPSAQTLEAIDRGSMGKETSARLLAGLVISSPDFQRR